VLVAETNFGGRTRPVSSNVDQTPGPPGGLWQTITNERFPRDARSIPNQRNPISVRVRVVWERDGEEWIDGDATRWTDRVVFVTFGDRRLSTIGVWVVPGEVRRR
jgi:hypothetical protein